MSAGLRDRPRPGRQPRVGTAPNSFSGVGPPRLKLAWVPREAWALFPGSVAYIWHAGTKAGIVQDSLAACGFETRSQIIWAKNNFAIGRGHYHCKHEPCWYV